MPLAFTSNTSFTLSSDTFKTQCKGITIDFGGLKPLTRHDCLVDGLNYNWATKQFGKNIGDDLISDVKGKINITILFEIPYEGTIAHDNIVTRVDNNLLLGNQSEQRTNNYMVTNKVIEIKGNNSYAKYIKTFRFLINPYHANRIEHHGH